MATWSEKRTSIYLSPELLAEIRAEAKRLDRSVSWVFEKAWRVAKNTINALPSEGEAP